MTKSRADIRQFVAAHRQTLSIVIAYVGICVVFSILSPHFMTFQNFKNIGLYASIIGVMAAGLTVPMLLGCLDLSQYSVATASSIVVTILAANMGWPIHWAVILAILLGAVCGLLNGIIVAHLNITSMIATMSTMYIFRAVCYIVTDGKSLVFSMPEFNGLARGEILFIPVSVWILVAVFVILGFVLNKTAYGRSVYAVGSNARASYLSGMNIPKIQITAFVISGACAAVAGIILLAQTGACVPSAGTGQEMEIIAAVVLGGLSLMGGKGKITGTVLGLLIMVTITNGLTLLSVQSYYQMLVRGMVIILAVYVDSGRQKKEYMN